jgi:hypothetical protein
MTALCVLVQVDGMRLLHPAHQLWSLMTWQVLGFGQVALLDEVAQVLVHGANFYDDLYAAVQDIESHDYRSAGTEMGKVT